LPLCATIAAHKERALRVLEHEAPIRNFLEESDEDRRSHHAVPGDSRKRAMRQAKARERR
jgi:hypothetical protein